MKFSYLAPAAFFALFILLSTDFLVDVQGAALVTSFKESSDTKATGGKQVEGSKTEDAAVSPNFVARSQTSLTYSNITQEILNGTLKDAVLEKEPTVNLERTDSKENLDTLPSLQSKAFETKAAFSENQSKSQKEEKNQIITEPKKDSDNLKVSVKSGAPEIIKECVSSSAELTILYDYFLKQTFCQEYLENLEKGVPLLSSQKPEAGFRGTSQAGKNNGPGGRLLGAVSTVDECELILMEQLPSWSKNEACLMNLKNIPHKLRSKIQDLVRTKFPRRMRKGTFIAGRIPKASMPHPSPSRDVQPQNSAQSTVSPLARSKSESALAGATAAEPANAADQSRLGNKRHVTDELMTRVMELLIMKLKSRAESEGNAHAGSRKSLKGIARMQTEFELARSRLLRTLSEIEKKQRNADSFTKNGSGDATGSVNIHSSKLFSSAEKEKKEKQ